MFDLDDLPHVIARGFGALLGVIASMMIVAPEGTKNAIFRLWVGFTMGFVFGPIMPQIAFLSWLGGEGVDHVMARAAAAGFTSWFALEILARLMSHNEWLVRLSREVLRIRAGGQDK